MASSSRDAKRRTIETARLSAKTGSFKKFAVFAKMLVAAVVDASETVFVDLLTYADLERLKRERGAARGEANGTRATADGAKARDVSPASQKRYLILTHADEFDRTHYPLPLVFEDDPSPQALQATVFDMYVNAGGNAVKILQRLLRDMGEPVSVDGAIGPQTLWAVARAAERAPDHIVDAYGIARRNYYFGIADRRPASRKYARSRAGGKGGWIKRAEEFISPRYHMTEAQFRARVASWG